MKKHLITFTLFLFSITAFAQHYTQKDLVGKWETKPGKDAQTFILRFTADNKLYLVAKSTQAVPPATYTADFTKDPIRVTLIVKTPKGETTSAKCLAKFINHDALKWQIFPNGGDPSDFDEKSAGTIAVMKRVK